ncbi:hypothetical protein BURPS1710A_A1706 [Burkholderia pseudomallei 1710a]|uniref:Uncharacterized protein n=1 Tax=Burkholderia pseudomallei 1710a TaxID=320371 RepID=A0A0E1W035_BURPE|nr:hypothetical protein BURPS1710A_A1706 [Burkholderia pseudomallei 1710a]
MAVGRRAGSGTARTPHRTAAAPLMWGRAAGTCVVYGRRCPDDIVAAA